MTEADFYNKWQDQHLPCINSSNDNGFYYQTYLKLEETIKQQGGGVIAMDHLLFSLLLFIEDEAGLGLTRTYRKDFKSAKDIAGVLLRQSKVNKETNDAVRAIVEEVIKVAPKSEVADAIRQSLADGDAQQFADIVCWLVRKTKIFSFINPPIHVREESYFKLLDYTLDIEATLKMTYFDFAFNRNDKECSCMPFHLGSCFEGDAETMARLDEVWTCDFKFYNIASMEDGYMYLVPRNGTGKTKVKSISPIPLDHKKKYLGCHLLSIDDAKTWIVPTSVCWKDEDFIKDFDQDDWLDDIDMAERTDTHDDEECGDHIEGIDKFEEVYGETWEEWEDYLDNEAWEDYAQGITDHYDGPRGTGIPGNLPAMLKQLLSTREGAEALLKHLMGDDIFERTGIPSYSDMPTKEFREAQGMEMPDYKRKPTGKYPNKFFENRICTIGDWRLRDKNDVTYALRAYEGWLKQAQQYFDEGRQDYSYDIAKNLLSGGSSFYEQHYKDYGQYASRIRKLVCDSHALMMQTIPHINVELQNDALAKLLAHRIAKWEIFEGHPPFDLEASITELDHLLHPDGQG